MNGTINMTFNLSFMIIDVKNWYDYKYNNVSCHGTIWPKREAIIQRSDHKPRVLMHTQTISQTVRITNEPRTHWSRQDAEWILRLFVRDADVSHPDLIPVIHEREPW